MQKSLIAAVLAAALALTACGGGSGSHSSTTSSSGSASAATTFGTNADRDEAFLHALGASPYASAYAAKTQKDLIQYGHDLCQQLTAPPASGLVEIMGMTQDEAARKFFGTQAVATYCPEAAALLPNLFG